MVSRIGFSMARSSSLRRFLRSAVSAMYAPETPDIPIASAPATPAAMMNWGSVMPERYAPMTTPSIVRAPSKAFMTK